MTDEVAAAGDVMTGALAARAVEPGTGSSHEQGGHAARCLNCRTELVGAHCHACGQSGHVHRTAGAIGHEIAHGVFHFDGKIWRTLPLLAFRPGELTRRYVDGERARFVSPLALFLFTVFLLFAVVANLPGAVKTDLDEATVGAELTEARAEIADKLNKARADAALGTSQLAAERRKAVPDRQATAKLARAIAKANRNVAELERTQRFLPPLDGQAATARPADTWLDAKFQQAVGNPRLLIYKVKTSAYKYSWALIPISLPFVWLLFPLRRDVGFYDHAVFATYSLSFMSLLVIATAVLASLGLDGPVLGLAAGAVPPVHIYRQLKGAYRLTRAGALWRTGWMLLFTLVTSTLFLLLLVAAGISN